MSSASSDDPSSQTSIIGGDDGVDYETDTGTGTIDDATREEHEEGEEQQHHHNGNLLGNHFSRRWLRTGKHWPLDCRRKSNWLRISKITFILLAIAVVARYMIIQYKPSVATVSWNNISATPPCPLSKKRRNLNLQLALSQIINPSTHHQIFRSLSVSNHQHPPNITLAALAAFTASCHPHAFTLATFLSHNLSGAFENPDRSFTPQQARAALFHAHELAVRAARAETKADTPARRTKQEDRECDRLMHPADKFDEKGMKRHHPRCRTRKDASQPSSSTLMTSTHTTQTGKLLEQDAMVIPQVDIAFENQTLYHHLISSPSSSYSGEKKEEAALYHQCEGLTDPHHAHTYLAQVVHILEELYMTAAAAAAAVPMEDRWAREVRDGFDEWFYERLLRVSSFCRRTVREDDYWWQEGVEGDR